jgi:hypothetical protein
MFKSFMDGVINFWASARDSDAAPVSFSCSERLSGLSLISLAMTSLRYSFDFGASAMISRAGEEPFDVATEVTVGEQNLRDGDMVIVTGRLVPLDLGGVVRVCPPGHDVLASDYRKLRVIRRGGFGEVWKGEDVRTGASVAIKELRWASTRERDVQCFNREIQFLTSFNHPTILQMIGVIQPVGLDGFPSFVLPWMARESALTVLK